MRKASTLLTVLGSVAITATAILLVQQVRASGIPTSDVLTYTGQLENPDGTAVTDATKNIGISAYDAATDGNLISNCTVASTVVSLTLGRFQIALPSTCPAQISANPDLWLDVLVDGASVGRTKLGAVPFAVEAGHAVNADLAVNATSATNATHAAAADTATSADTAAAASGALKTTVDQLVTDVAARAISGVDAVPGDQYYDECLNSGLADAQLCNLMGHYTCRDRGYTSGWFRGDEAVYDDGQHLGLICIK